MRVSIIVTLAIVLISFIIGVIFYPKMPERMASHWNIRDEVDGYTSRFWGIFLMPLISLGFLLLFLIIPIIDPLKENIKKFLKYFDLFIIFLFIFLLYLYLLTLFWNLGARFPMSKMLIPALSLFFFYCGVLVANAKRNWFIGIRTPWTLSNEIVWEKTHKIGGKLFKIAGIFALFGLLFPAYAFYFVIIPILFVAFFTIVYSYFIYQKLRETKFKDA
ncbi:MAG: SdpI family protein [candidate division WOR-3 bacterium]